MSPSYQLHSYDKILDGVIRTQEWYRSLGISTQGTRLDAIRSTIESIIHDITYRSPEDVLAEINLERAFYALTDGSSFGRIQQDLSQLPSSLLRRSDLKRILQGPLCPTEETPSSTDGRNVFVELEMAADFIRQGIQVTGFDDLKFKFGRTDFSLQCKRPFHPGTVERNVKSAYAQLGRNFKSDHDRGLLALAVEKALKLDGKIFPIKSGREIEVEVRKLSRSFDREHGKLWASFVDNRIIGVLLIFKFLCHNLQRNTIDVAHIKALIPLVSDGMDRALVEKLYTNLRPEI
jgi:hypothetical protein